MSAFRKSKVFTNRNTWIYIFLGLATLLVYARVARFDFTTYDDDHFVYQNPVVTSGLTVRGFFWALETSYYDFWHPLTWWSHMLDCELFGLSPGAHHLVNVAFHVANVLLLFSLFERMTGSWKRSAMVAALFAVHPVHVESVAWVSERKDVLCAFFFLLSLRFYLRFVEAANHQTGTSSRNFNLALVCFALALMAKAMAVTLPFVLLLLDYWPLGRISNFKFLRFEANTTTDVTSPVRKSLWALIQEKLSFFVLSLISCVITYRGMNAQQNVLSADRVTWGFRFANASVSYVRYLGKLIWPSNLCAYYPRPDHWPITQVAVAVLILLLISIIAVALIRRAPYLVIGWCFFLGTLVPVIGIVAMNTQSMNDRYTYIPSVGLFAALVWTLADLSRNWNWRPVLKTVLALIVLTLCAGVAWKQVGYWRNGITLWTRCLAVNPNRSEPHFGIALALVASNRVEEAIAQYREGLKIDPHHPEANNNLGVLYLHSERFEEATNSFGRALAAKPRFLQACMNMANTLYELKRFADATNYYAQCLMEVPNDQTARERYARDLEALGDSVAALRILNSDSTTLGLNPASAADHYALGMQWMKRGSYAQALAEFQEVLRLHPASDGLESSAALEKKAKTRATLAQCREALRLNPTSASAMNDLAWVLATSSELQLRSGVEAVELAEKACAATSYREPSMIGTLAAAYAETGRFDSAIETAQKACTLATSLGETNVLKKNQELLQMYRAGKTAP